MTSRARPRGLVLSYLIAVVSLFVGVGIALRAAPEGATAFFEAATLDARHAASRPWSWLTFALFHAPEQPVQLVFGLLCVYAFGPELEAAWSRLRFVGLFVAASLAGALAVVVVGALGGPRGLAAGAPAFASALLVAWCVGNRRRQVHLWMVPVSGLQLLVVALALEAWSFVSAPSPTGVAELAALAVGAAFADDTPVRRALLRARLRKVEARRAGLRVIPGGRAKPSSNPDRLLH